MTDERTPEEAERARQELLARYEDLHERAVHLQESMNAVGRKPRSTVIFRSTLLIGGLIGLPVGGYFALGWPGILIGVVLFVIAVWLAIRIHEAKMRREHPKAYAPGKGYIG